MGEEVKEVKFPYTVNVDNAKLNDNKCCSEVSNYTGFSFFRCSKEVKEYIDGIGFCGIHAKSIKNWRKK